MSSESMTPINAFVTAIAYVILADKKTVPEERAELVTLLGKHANQAELSASEIQKVTADAFAYVARNEFTTFLTDIDGVLGPAQVIALLANMYETMIVDGRVVAREREIIEEFYRFFDVDRRIVATLREIIVVKNDTGLFLRPDHPSNGSDFTLDFLRKMDQDV